MNDQPLSGVGVLVTRPEHQSAELKYAIEAAGGQAFLFPAISIEQRAIADIESDLMALRDPDIVIFVSVNAVRYGLESVRDGQTTVAAIGPATAEALEDAGVNVDIIPDGGFDSEQLLATEQLSKFSGTSILIVRGTSGREFLSETLRDRGATVEYLSVYDRSRYEPARDDLENLEKSWRDGRINAVMVMSVASLHGLLEILPAYCIGQLPETRLVAPSARVIQTGIEKIPGITAILSPEPGAVAMTGALIANLQADSEIDNG